MKSDRKNENFDIQDIIIDYYLLLKFRIVNKLKYFFNNSCFTKVINYANFFITFGYILNLLT